jgi:hypothetical protein
MAIAVAVAGAVGLQTLFSSVEGDFRQQTGADPARADFIAWVGVTDGWAQVGKVDAQLEAVPGVQAVLSTVGLSLTWGEAPTAPVLPATGDDGTPVVPCDRDECGPANWSNVTVGDCAALMEFAVIDVCAEGDVFAIEPTAENSWTPAPRPGQEVMVGDPYDDSTVLWTVPASTRVVAVRADPTGASAQGLLATPSAMPTDLLTERLTGFSAYVTVDDLDRDAVERLRNAMWRVDIASDAYPIRGEVEVEEFASVRRGLFAGVTLTLVLIGMSLLVTVLDQLRERRRVLASLVAVGTRRRTLAWSILWQTTVPVVLGMALAIAAGTAIAIALLKITDQPVHLDWPVMALFAGIAAFVVLAVAALSTPALFRLMRADGLRTE